jgi:hypothetical protein
MNSAGLSVCPSTFTVHVSQWDVTDKGSKVFTSGIFMASLNCSLVLSYANSVLRQSANAQCSTAFRTHEFLEKYFGTRSLHN